MTPKIIKKSKMTLDKLAQMTQREFLHLNGEITEIRENMATKEDLKLFATKEDLGGLRDELKDDIRKGTVDILQAVDVIVTKFDKVEKDHAADKLLHDRHEKRLERVESKLGVKSI